MKFIRLILLFLGIFSINHMHGMEMGQLNCQELGPLLQKLTVQDLYPQNQRQKLSSNTKNLPFIIRAFPAQKIYQMRVDKQEGYTCGRHSIKNLIFTIDAFGQVDENSLKSALIKLLDRRASMTFNKDVCDFLGIRDYKNGLTFRSDYIKVFTAIKDGTFLERYPKSNQILPDKTQQISRQIFDHYLCCDPRQAMLQKALREAPRSEMLSRFFQALSSTPSKDLLEKNYISVDAEDPWARAAFMQCVYDFRTTDQTLRGFVLILLGNHAISVIVHKVKGSFEYFVLDSENSKEPRTQKSNEFPTDSLIVSLENLGAWFSMPIDVLKKKIFETKKSLLAQPLKAKL